MELSVEWSLYKLQKHAKHWKVKNVSIQKPRLDIFSPEFLILPWTCYRGSQPCTCNAESDFNFNDVAEIVATVLLFDVDAVWDLFSYNTNPKTQKDSTFHRTFLYRGTLFLYLFRRVSSIVTLNFGLYFIVSTVIINSRQARWTWTAFQINVGHRWLVSSSWLRSSNKIEMMMDCWIMTWWEVN